MAIGTVTATRAAAGFPVAAGGTAGDLKVAWGTYDIGAAVADNDIIKMCKLPRGATVVWGVVYGEDIDTGTEALDFDIGWAANGDEAASVAGFGNNGVVTGDASVHLPIAGIGVLFSGVLLSDGPKTFNAETTLQVEFNAAANAGGTGRLTMVVFYTV